jgi:hypothetical protein
MVAFSPGLRCRAFALGKDLNFSDETDDAFAVNTAAGRFAIADGASTSAFAAAWARILATTFVENRNRWSVWLPLARDRWEQECRRDEMPWYLQEQFADGALATLTGVVFRGKRRWRAAAVGDSCLFHVRRERVCRVFPIRAYSDFNQTPALLCSRAEAPGRQTSRLRIEGDWLQGDLMLLATDALSQWFLGQVEDGKEPWRELVALERQDAFTAWISEHRRSNSIRPDDVTVLIIDSLA